MLSILLVDIKCQLVDRFKKIGKHALQLDESTDILNSAQLLVFIRYSVTENIMLFCSALEWTCTGEDIFTKTKRRGAILRKLYCVCRNRAGAMLGERQD